MAEQPTTINERVSGLETSVRVLVSDLNSLRETVANGFRDLQNAANSNNRTNWPVVFMALGMLGALYAGAIKPVTDEQTRQIKSSETLAAAVVEQNRMVAALNVELSKNIVEVHTLDSTMQDIKKYGTPGADKRLEVLEYQMSILNKEADRMLRGMQK